jgi:hypothetical protein
MIGGQSVAAASSAVCTPKRTATGRLDADLGQREQITFAVWLYGLLIFDKRTRESIRADSGRRPHRCFAN